MVEEEESEFETLEGGEALGNDSTNGTDAETATDGDEPPIEGDVEGVVDEGDGSKGESAGGDTAAAETGVGDENTSTDKEEKADLTKEPLV